MIISAYILASLSYLIMAAHFLRNGNLLITSLSVFLPFLLFIKKRWILYGVSIVLFLASLMWIDTIINIYFLRVNAGMPFVKMIIILLFVSLLALIGGLLLLNNKVKSKYLNSKYEITKSIAFVALVLVMTML